jgi:hypothetical protein
MLIAASVEMRSAYDEFIEVFERLEYEGHDQPRSDPTPKNTCLTKALCYYLAQYNMAITNDCCLKSGL